MFVLQNANLRKLKYCLRSDNLKTDLVSRTFFEILQVIQQASINGVENIQ